MTYRTASCHISNCNSFRHFRGEQDTIKVNNLVVGHWLNILCKRGGVSNGIIAISTTLTSRMQLSTCTFIYWNLLTQKTGQRKKDKNNLTQSSQRTKNEI